jgi:hypothetical protein
VESNTVLSARLEQTVTAQQHMAEQSALQSDGQKTMLSTLDKLCDLQTKSLSVLTSSDVSQQEWSQLLAQQQQLLQQVLTQEQPWGEAFGQLAQSQSAQWAQLQAQWAQGLSALAEQVQAERAQGQAQAQSQLAHLQAQWAQSLSTVAEQVQTERTQWQSHAQSQTAEQQQLVQAVLSMVQHNELAQAKSAEQWQQRVQQQADAHSALTALQKNWADLLAQSQQQLTTDSQQRLELAERSRQGLAEMQARQEQLFHAVLSHKS